MKFKSECPGVKWEKKKAWLEQWHTHYALFPVRINEQEEAWLEYVERKGTRLYSSF